MIRTQPVRSVITTVARRLPWIAVAACLGGALAFAGQNALRSDVAEANSRVGLTTESEWPRHETNLESFVAAATAPDLVAQVGDELDIDELHAEASLIQGIFVVDLTVSAEAGADVVTATDRLVQAGIDHVTTLADGDRLLELDALTESLTAVQGELVDVASDLDRADRAVTEGAAILESDWRFTVQTQWDLDNAERQRLVSSRDGLLGREQQLRNAIEDRELTLLGSRDRLFVVKDPAIVEETAPLSNGLTAPLGVATAVAASVGASFLWFDRKRGLIRDTWQVEEILGLPILAVTNGDGSMQMPISRRLVQAIAASDDVVTIGIWSANDAVDDQGAVMEGISTLLTPLTTASGGLRLVSLSSDDAARTAAPAGTEGCDAIVSIVDQNRTTMDSLRQGQRALAVARVPLLGVVLST